MSELEQEEKKEIMQWREIERPDYPHELVCWPGTVVLEGQESNGELEEWFKNAFPTMTHPIIPVGCVQTLPDIEHREDDEPRTGGRCDFMFIVNAEDAGGFAIPRFKYGMRWWEDVMANEAQHAQDAGHEHDAYSIYPADFRTAMEGFRWD